MTKFYILDDGGNPLPTSSITDWAKWFESSDRFVATTHVGEARVSTVFLGMDHSFVGGGEPILWETMIFGGKQDGYQERYSSKLDALRGHNHAVKLAREAASPRGLRWIIEKCLKTSFMQWLGRKTCTLTL